MSLQELKNKYPEGTLIKALHMEDPFGAIKPGMLGVVKSIDEMGQMHMQWEDNWTVCIDPEVDKFVVYKS